MDGWAEPRALVANAEGELTPEQRAMVAGERVRPPIFAYILLVVWSVPTVLAGIAGAEPGTRNDEMPDGGLAGALAMGGSVGLVIAPYLLVPALFMAVPRWRERRRRRRRVAALRLYRIHGAVGRIEDEGILARARVGDDTIPVPAGAPPLPAPGPYRLHWLESGSPGSAVLLSAEPVDLATCGTALWESCGCATCSAFRDGIGAVSSTRWVRRHGKWRAAARSRRAADEHLEPSPG